MAIDIERVRTEFPSLAETDDGTPRIYFDNPGGTQVPKRVVERTLDYFTHSNANHEGAFRTSIASDAILSEAHEAMAALLNASSGDEIVFGQNMTSLTFAVSRSIGRTLAAGDEIVVTRMDHDANISPWLLLADDLGLEIKWLDFSPESFRYDLDGLDELLGGRTRLIAVNYASNAIGTVNDVARIAGEAKQRGVLTYVDAVQYAPHAPTDVARLGCDFLVCSAYKFFGPHQGILWGRRDVLSDLVPYKVRPASDRLPFRFETGTLSHEGLAGTLGAVEYLEWIGTAMGADDTVPCEPSSPRTKTLHAGMAAIRAYEEELCRRLIAGLQSIRGLRVYGITDPESVRERVPTVSFTMNGIPPHSIARRLAEHNIFAWDGDYYAVEVIRRLGLGASGGMLRIGLAHYNTRDEVDVLLDVLEHMSSTS